MDHVSKKWLSSITMVALTLMSDGDETSILAHVAWHCTLTVLLVYAPLCSPYEMSFSTSVFTTRVGVRITNFVPSFLWANARASMTLRVFPAPGWRVFLTRTIFPFVVTGLWIERSAASIGTGSVAIQEMYLLSPWALTSKPYPYRPTHFPSKKIGEPDVPCPKSCPTNKHTR